MKLIGGRLVERYIIWAILPYFGLSLLLLTFVILAQQAGKFVEILNSADPTIKALGDIILGLIPNILIFTLPMSVLIGTATGLSRLSSDSELIAMRAAGIGTWRVVTPVVLLGGVFTLLTLYVGFEIAPAASSLMRQAAIKVALSKLESPIQPQVFNTEMPGKVVYVRDGNKQQGQWGRVFIHWQESENDVRLITAKSGRLDVTGDQTELVLTDSVVTTLPSRKVSSAYNPMQVVKEKASQFRIRLNTGRNALLKRFEGRRLETDELGWREILERAQIADGTEKRNLLTALNKRLALCCAPLAFALLGAGLGTRTSRIGRGQAVLVSIGVMLLYYLILLGGENLSRKGTLLPQVGSWLSTLLSAAVGLLALFWRGRHFSVKTKLRSLASIEGSTAGRLIRARRIFLLGHLDRSLLRAVSFNFALAYLTLLSIFLIFTLFELLRFITGQEWGLLALYLLYLIPLASMSLVPIGLLVAVLITYAILAKRNEVFVWWASGQSIYRLSLPTLLFSLLISVTLGFVQENILPQANKRQENYRAQIRGSLNRAVTATGIQWLATKEGNRLYSYRFDESGYSLINPVVYEFDPQGVHIERLIFGESGKWRRDGELGFEQAQVMDIGDRKISQTLWGTEIGFALADNAAPESFKPLINKPSELNTPALSRYISALRKVRPDDIPSLNVALYKRTADIMSPIILAAIGVPFGVFFGRRSTFWALGVAIIIGLSLWASASAFQQLGNYRLLPAPLAAWATPLIFSALALLLFSRART